MTAFFIQFSLSKDRILPVKVWLRVNPLNLREFLNEKLSKSHAFYPSMPAAGHRLPGSPDF